MRKISKQTVGDAFLNCFLSLEFLRPDLSLLQEEVSPNFLLHMGFIQLIASEEDRCYNPKARSNIASQKARYMMNIHCFQRSFSANSSRLVPVPLPSRMEAHFWYIIPDEVKDKRLMNQYLELLSPCEKESILRIQGEQQRKRALLARALVRTTIARYQTNYQLDPRSLRFGKNMYGKPEVTWQKGDDWHIPPLQFNISHTSSMVACGLTSHSPIGIDVEEKLRKLKNNILVFANRYFSPEEVRLLTAISDTEIQRQEFIKLWTLKESYVKAIGRGFSGAPFKTFTIQYRDVTKDVHPECIRSEVSDIVVKPSGDSEKLTSNWHFSLMELAGSHYGAVCMEKDEEAIGDEARDPMRVRVWRTIPLVEDEGVSGTDTVLPLGLFHL